MSFKVAIDGPAGSGKSTISKLVADELGFCHIDTGAMFRAVALYMIRNNCNDFSFLNDIEIVYKDGCIYLNNEDVSKEIRLPNVTNLVSEVAKVKEVREKILEVERKSASIGNCILDGRDIGEKVLPDANLKIFLTADARKRAERRYKDNLERGIKSDIDVLEREIKKRDFDDENRKESPLKRAKDAILIDSTNMNIDDVKKEIIRLVKERL